MGRHGYLDLIDEKVGVYDGVLGTYGSSRSGRAPRWRRTFATVLAPCLLAIGLAGCTSDDPTPASPPGEVARDQGAAPTSTPLAADDPIRRAEEFLAGFAVGGDWEVEITPESVAVLDYVSRRWDRPRLADPGQARDLLVPAGSHPGYARLFEPGVELTPDEAAQLDHVMGPALQCDVHLLPADYGAVLQERIDLGGYDATHVLLALVWVDELGCLLSEGAELLGAAVDRVAGELALVDQVTDLSAEQIAFLDYAGALDRVDPSWEDVLVRSQLDDGGWPHDPSIPFGRWHTAGTAWWALLAFREPGDRSARMIPGG